MLRQMVLTIRQQITFTLASEAAPSSLKGGHHACSSIKELPALQIFSMALQADENDRSSMNPSFLNL